MFKGFLYHQLNLAGKCKVLELFQKLSNLLFILVSSELLSIILIDTHTFSYLHLELSTASELVYAFDTSNDVTSDNIEKIKDFITNEIKQHTPVSKVALVNFGSNALVESELTSDSDYLVSRLSKAQAVGGSSRVDLALQTIRDKLFTRRFRNLPLRQVVLITNMKNKLGQREAIIKFAQELKDFDKAKIIVLAVGDDINKKLVNDISSGKDSSLSVERFDEMPSVVDEMFGIIAGNAGK